MSKEEACEEIDICSPLQKTWRKPIYSGISNSNNMTPISVKSDFLERCTTRSTRSTRTANQCTAVFNMLQNNKLGTLSSFYFIDELESQGILKNDPRIQETMKELQNRGGIMRDIELTSEDFLDIICENTVFISKIFTKLIVSDWLGFTEEIKQIYEKVKTNSVEDHHVVSSFTADLQRMDPDYFSICICTVDGQRFSIGDADTHFTLQDLSKPISYLMALQENGADVVGTHVGTEPSGDQRDSISLKKISENKRIPYNPLIDHGAIMVCSLIKSQETMAFRFGWLMDVWSKLVGGGRPGFNNPNYLSQKSSGDRSWCLAHLMKQHNAFPKETDIKETLEFYFQNRAIEITNNQLAFVAATLANGGTNPYTGEIIFDNELVRNCLSILLSSGMYQSSGRWCFEIGLPAMASCSGGLLMVIPSKMGIAIFSPRMSGEVCAKGLEVCREIVNTFSFHQYDILKGLTRRRKSDPCKNYGMGKYQLENLLFAAAEGDLKEVQRVSLNTPENLFEQDYDHRTVLHLAASEGTDRIVQFIVHQAQALSKDKWIEKLSPKDRWQRTPLDDAYSGGHKKVIEILEAAGARRAYSFTGVHRFQGGIFKNSTFLNIRKEPESASSAKQQHKKCHVVSCINSSNDIHGVNKTVDCIIIEETESLDQGNAV